MNHQNCKVFVWELFLAIMMALTVANGIKAFYSLMMGGAGIFKLIDKGFEEWTTVLNFCKWFQFAVGIVELLMSVLCLYQLILNPSTKDTFGIDINLLCIFMGFVLIGGIFFTFYIRANINTFIERITNSVGSILVFVVLYGWIYFDELTVPIYVWSGIIFGFLGGLIIPSGSSVHPTKKSK